MKNQLKLVIFDMDGLMFDTERINYEAWLEAATLHQFPIDKKIHTSMIGIREKDIPTFLEKIYGKEADITGWQKQVIFNQKEYITKNKTVHKKKGLIELLNYLESNEIKMAVASSSSTETIEYYLDLEGIRHYFDCVVSGEEVENGKPAPDIFLKACESMKVPPENAIVLEDSIHGLKAARAAKIHNIFIPDRIQVSDELREISDVIRDDLSEVIAYIENRE